MICHFGMVITVARSMRLFQRFLQNASLGWKKRAVRKDFLQLIPLQTVIAGKLDQQKKQFVHITTLPLLLWSQEQHNIGYFLLCWACWCSDGCVAFFDARSFLFFFFFPCLRFVHWLFSFRAFAEKTSVILLKITMRDANHAQDVQRVETEMTYTGHDADHAQVVERLDIEMTDTAYDVNHIQDVQRVEIEMTDTAHDADHIPDVRSVGDMMSQTTWVDSLLFWRWYGQTADVTLWDDGVFWWLCNSISRVIVCKRWKSSLVRRHQSSIRSSIVVSKLVCSWYWIWRRARVETDQKLFLRDLLERFFSFGRTRLLIVVQTTHVREIVSSFVMGSPHYQCRHRYLILLDRWCTFSQ